MPHPLVVHCKRSPFDVYVGRKSGGAPRGVTGEWGNPFAMANQSLAERNRVVQEYEEWLLQQPGLLAKAKKELRGKTLACWCAPKACHADVLARLANADDDNDGEEGEKIVVKEKSTACTRNQKPENDHREQQQEEEEEERGTKGGNLDTDIGTKGRNTTLNPEIGYTEPPSSYAKIAKAKGGSIQKAARTKKR